MLNDPKKWPEQSWQLPYEGNWQLKRNRKKWVIDGFLGAVQIPVKARIAEEIVAATNDLGERAAKIQEAIMQPPGLPEGVIYHDFYSRLLTSPKKEEEPNEHAD